MTKCSKHPKYKGDKQPRAKNCEGCLILWAKMIWGKYRREHSPIKVIPDKTKYTRKKKHK